MTWTHKDEYAIRFFPIFGELDHWEVYISSDEKASRKVFKDVVSQWEKKEIIVLDAFSVKANSVDVIVLSKK